ncbi:MAG: hypothetical protein AB1352_00180 [Patescibacteria group bacterium]
MLIKKVFHWVGFFVVLSSFTLITLVGARDFTSVEEALAQGFDEITDGELFIVSDVPTDIPSSLRLARREQVCRVKSELFENLASSLPSFNGREIQIGHVRVRLLNTTGMNLDVQEFMRKFRLGEEDCMTVSFHSFLYPFFHGGVS